MTSRFPPGPKNRSPISDERSRGIGRRKPEPTWHQSPDLNRKDPFSRSLHCSPTASRLPWPTSLCGAHSNRGEEEPVSGVKAPGGLKYYDKVIWIDKEHQTRWVRAGSAHPNDGRHGWEEETFRFTGLPAGTYRVSAVTYPPRDRKLRQMDPTPHGVTTPVGLGDEGNKQVSIKVQLGGSAPLVLHAVDAENRNDLKGLVVRLRNSEGLPIVLGSGDGNYFERTNEEGEVVYSRLQPGEYTVEVFGRRAYLNEFVQYKPLDEPIRFQVKGN